MLYFSILAVMGFLWACTDELYNPGILPPEITSIDPAAAFETQPVTIYGSNFSSAAAENIVSFNGIAATVTSTTTLAIKTTVPVGASTGDVTVTVNGKTSTAYSFEVLIPVIPTISSLSITSGKVRDQVIIYGTNFSTTPSENVVSFNGTPAVVTASTATSITTKVPGWATTGEVTVTTDVASNGVVFTVLASNNLDIAVDESLGDVEEASSTGMIDVTSSDLELGEFDTTGDPDYGLQTIGLRFNNVTIPAGSTILAASVQFTCDATGEGPVQLTIYGEDVGNSSVFEEAVQYTVSQRPRTAVNAVWDVLPWLVVGESGPAQMTCDLADVVQAIVDRGDWTSGNSMAFIFEHSGPSIGVTSSSDGREAETIDGTAAPILKIIYD